MAHSSIVEKRPVHREKLTKRLKEISAIRRAEKNVMRVLRKKGLLKSGNWAAAVRNRCGSR